MNGYLRFSESDYRLNVDMNDEIFIKLTHLEEEENIGITYPYKKTIDIPKGASSFELQFNYKYELVTDFTTDFTGDVAFMHYTFDDQHNMTECRLPTFPKAFYVVDFFILGFSQPFIRFNFTDDTRPETITITFTAFLRDLY